MRAFFLICFLSIICGSGFGQVSFGLKGGVNLNNIVTKDVPASIPFINQNDVAIGFHIGLFSQIKLTDRLSLIPELQYSQRGVKYTSGGNSRTIKVNYLELPILASYSIKSFAIDFGPQVSYRLSSTIDAYKDFDFGLIGGARFNFAGNFSMIAKYYYGLTAISEIAFTNSNGQSLGNAGDYSRNIQFGIGYKIK